MPLASRIVGGMDLRHATIVPWNFGSKVLAPSEERIEASRAGPAHVASIQDFFFLSVLMVSISTALLRSLRVRGMARDSLALSKVSIAVPKRRSKARVKRIRIP